MGDLFLLKDSFWISTAREEHANTSAAGRKYQVKESQLNTHNTTHGF
jgi:hypothetical protein